MRSFQTIIEEQLQIVKERDEIITPDELHLICVAERTRPPGETWYSKHRDLVSVGRKIGAGSASVLTLGLYGWYRKATDKCAQRCKGMTGKQATRCNAVCNMNASKHVLDKLQSNKSKLSSIKDPEQRAKASAELRREFEKWQDRYEKYKDRAQSTALMTTQMQMKRDKD